MCRHHGEEEPVVAAGTPAALRVRPLEEGMNQGRRLERYPHVFVMSIPHTDIEDFRRRAVENGGCLDILDLPDAGREDALVVYARSEEHRTSISAICVIAVLSKIRLFSPILSLSPGAQKVAAASAFVLSAGLGALGFGLFLMYHNSDGVFHVPIALVLPTNLSARSVSSQRHGFADIRSPSHSATAAGGTS